MVEKLKLPHPLILIIVIGFLLYARSLTFDYTNFDDNSLIRDNQNYISDISNIADAFKKTVFITGSDIFYRPVETVWFIINAQFAGDGVWKELPAVFHVSSLLLHFFAVYLILILLRRLNNSEETSLFLSLIFLVHPVFTQVVVWVPGVVDILAAVFAVSAFLFFLDFIDTRQRKYFVLHLLFFALALYTKEISVGIIVVCFSYLYFIKKSALMTVQSPARQGHSGGDGKTLASYSVKAFLTGWAIIFVLWFMMRDSALQQQKQKGILEMSVSIVNNLPAFIQYIGKILFPFNLSVMPVISDTTFIYGVIVLLVIIFALYFSKDKRSGWILFSVIWFVIFLLPTFIQTSSFRIHQSYEHRMYLPMIGILFLAAETNWLKKFSTEKISNRIISLVVIVFFFVVTFRHEKVFSDTKPFLDNALNTSPGSSLAHRNMGIYYQDNNLLREASEEYLKSLALNPHEKDLHNNLGVIYDSWGKKDLAEKEYLTEVRLNPANSQAPHNLGVLCAERNENEKAEIYFKKALAARQNKTSYEQLALLYKKTGRQQDLDKIIRVLQNMDKAGQGSQHTLPTSNGRETRMGGKATPNSALQSDPISLGKQLMQQGRMQEAETVFKNILMRDSLNTQVLFNLGLIYYSAKQLDAAEIFWRKAVRIDSTYTDAFNNLAISLAQQGKNADAEAVLKKIISSNPNYIDGYYNIANFYARNGKEKEALYYVNELKKRGITKEQFEQRGVKLTDQLKKLF